MGINKYPNVNQNNNPNTNPVVWSSESYDGGERAEKLVGEFLEKVLGLEGFSEEDENAGKVFKDVRFRKTTYKEDVHEKGGDFVIYRPDTNEYVHFDVTTSRNPSVINYKRRNAEENNLKLLIVRTRTLENAIRGATVDQNELIRDIREQVLELGI
jgi:hypothetical protein